MSIDPSPIKRVMTVEATLEISGHGLILLPAPLNPARRGDFGVEIKRPDGSTLTATLSVTRWEWMFKTLKEADVPIGSEIWG